MVSALVIISGMVASDPADLEDHMVNLPRGELIAITWKYCNR